MKRRIDNEKGAALVVALGVLVVISILGVAALTAANGSVNQTVWDRSSNQAFNLAEAGFNQAVSRARNNMLSGGFTTKLANGEAQVTVGDLATFIYSVKSVGAQPTLASPKARRAVAGNVTALNPYDVMMVSGGVSGTILGNASINGPLYVRDYLSLSGSGAGAGSITGGPLFIKDNPATTDRTGDLEMTGNSSIGTDVEPIYAFIDGTITKGASAQIYTKAIYSDVPDLEMPVITGSLSDMQAQRAKANLVIDGDTTTSGNRPLALDYGAADQTFGNYPGGYYLKWTATALKKRKLEINGVVFVDGPVNIGANQITDVTYDGRGTIVANGPIAIDSAFAPSPTSDFPSNKVFGFVTGYQADINAKTGDNVYAVLYAYQRINIVNKINFWGSAMSQVLNLQSNPTLNVVEGVGESLPPGMPEVKTTTGITGWREVRP